MDKTNHSIYFFVLILTYIFANYLYLSIFGSIVFSLPGFGFILFSQIAFNLTMLVFCKIITMVIPELKTNFKPGVVLQIIIAYLLSIILIFAVIEDKVEYLLVVAPFGYPISSDGFMFYTSNPFIIQDIIAIVINFITVYLIGIWTFTEETIKLTRTRVIIENVIDKLIILTISITTIFTLLLEYSWHLDTFDLSLVAKIIILAGFGFFAKSN